ncbi:hypothetical protein HDV00_010749 [Rhizophlyctis rosea]|nr:hypothetical protein HDV00_010749 [Rhizophlyctis rosea]
MDLDDDDEDSSVPRYSGAAKAQLAYDAYAKTISQRRHIPIKSLQASTSPSSSLTENQLLRLMVKDRDHKRNDTDNDTSSNNTSTHSSNSHPRSDESREDGDTDSDSRDSSRHLEDHTHKTDQDRQRQCANTAFREAMIRDGETKYREKQAAEDDV